MEELGPISEHPNQHCGLDSMEQYPLPASAPPHPLQPPCPAELGPAQAPYSGGKILGESY